MNNWQENNPHVNNLRQLQLRSQRRKMLRGWLLIASVGMLLGLLLLGTGCAAQSPKPCEPLPPISKPVPDRSLPSVSYSNQVQTWLDESAKKLMNGQSSE